MTDLMEQGYNKEIDLYSRDIISQYHCQASLCTLPLDRKKHEKLKKTLSFSYYEKAAKKVTPFSNCQIVFQNILDKNAHDNSQPRPPQIYSKFFILQLHSFHAFQKKFHSVP